MRIPFGGLTPDKPDLANSELETALNCIPYGDSYGPFPEAVAYSTSVSGIAYGAVSTVDVNGNAYTFVGTTGQLYRESAAGMANVSRTASYAVATNYTWEFATFGNTFLAVNGFDAMQVFTLGTSTIFRDQSASASAPVAAHITSVRDFVMVGNISGAQNQLRWCQINNPLRWTTSQQKQADFQDLPGSSRIRRVLGGDFVTILTETSVWRGSYVGSPLIFRFDEVAPGVGLEAAGAAARFQNVTYFRSTSGFYAFDGQQAFPIGNERVDQYFRDDLNRAYVSRMSSTIDPVNKLFILSYPSVSSTDGTCDKLAMYGWAVDKWTFVEQSLEQIFVNLTSAVTLEGLDAYGTVDTIAVSFDSDNWIGGAATLGGIDANHRITRFTGADKTARFITGESQLIENSRAFLRSIRPLVQGDSATSITVYPGGRDRLVDDVTWNTGSVMNANGDCPVRMNNRYQRIRMDVAGGFDRVMGADLDFVKEGVR